MRVQAMIDAGFFTKKRNVLVVGAGRSGMAALRLLAQQGCHLAISDGSPFSALSDEDQQWIHTQKVFQEFGGHDLKTFLCAHCIVVSPGVPLDMEELVAAREKQIPIIGELELGSLFTETDIVAVTGTNGKTTVTTMIGDLLREDGRKVFVGGNIGTPLCEFVANGDDVDVLVLEVSSFQLDTTMSFHPHIALLLNITPDHLDRYPSYDAYADSKMRIFNRQQRDDVAIINGTDKDLTKRLAMIPSTIREFGQKKSSHARLADAKVVLCLPKMAEEEYHLPHFLAAFPNNENCLAAIMAVRLLGCRAESIAKGLAHFKCLEHRLTEVATVDGVEYIDDSKATNVGALKSALAGMTKAVHLIAGGRDKGGEYKIVGEQIREKVKNLILIGEAADKIAECFSGDVAISRACSMEEAVAIATRLAVAGEVVLLSPACASFDMFSSYVERGNAFQEAVGSLAEGAIGPAVVSRLSDPTVENVATTREA